MTAVIAVVLLLLLAAGALVGANFCVPGGGAQQALLGLGGALVGMILPSLPAWLQSLQTKPPMKLGPPSSRTPVIPGAAAVLVVVAALATASCHSVKPDQFFEATVDCAKVNPESSAALGAVTTCLVGAVSGNPAACLAGLVTEAHWTVTEVACIVAWVAERENQKVTTHAAGPASLEVRNRAISWLVQERIAIRNTYAGSPP